MSPRIKFNNLVNLIQGLLLLSTVLTGVLAVTKHSPNTCPNTLEPINSEAERYPTVAELVEVLQTKSAILPTKNTKHLLTSLTEMTLVDIPIENALKYFEDAKLEVRMEQARHTVMKVSTETSLEKETLFRNQAIEDAGKSFNSSAENQILCQGDLDRANPQLAANLDEQKTQKAALDALIKIRNDQRAVYEVDMVNFDKAKQSMRDVYPYIKQLSDKVGVTTTNTATFVQMKELHMGLASKSVEIFLTLKKFNALKSGPEAAEIMKIMAQMSQEDLSTKEGVIARLNSLIDKLITAMQELQDAETVEENDRIRVFNEQKANLEKIIASLQLCENALRAFINDATSCILQEQGIQTLATNKISRNQKLLATGLAEAEQFFKEYYRASQSRTDAIAMYDEAIDWIASYFGDKLSHPHVKTPSGPIVGEPGNITLPSNDTATASNSTGNATVTPPTTPPVTPPATPPSTIPPAADNKTAAFYQRGSFDAEAVYLLQRDGKIVVQNTEHVDVEDIDAEEDRLDFNPVYQLEEPLKLWS